MKKIINAEKNKLLQIKSNSAKMSIHQGLESAAVEVKPNTRVSVGNSCAPEKQREPLQ